MRHVLTGAAMLLVVGTTAACGGDAPDDASKGDFCEAFSSVTKLDDGKDLNALGDELEEVGTPDDISDEERDGFEVFVEAAQDVDEDAKPDDFEGEADFSKDEDKDVEAFTTYASKKCADELDEAAGVPSTDETPAESETDVPTDGVPTDDDPSDDDPTDGDLTGGPFDESDGQGDTPDAAKDEFCEEILGAGEITTAKQVRDWGEAMEQVGAPADMSDDEREGFEIVLDAARNAENGPDGEVKEPDISAAEQKKVDAFGQYVGEECAPPSTPAPNPT
ncbi:hypothetical protein [Nocardioides speluncae]|uniref:hypothetical protein n=1 Tax=Nocardioides speluncae TaxID=2670337 RepID=UPI000D69145D|nr:hypothetical protein [Nocardioides speluncae]